MGKIERGERSKRQRQMVALGARESDLKRLVGDLEKLHKEGQNLNQGAPAQEKNARDRDLTLNNIERVRGEVVSLSQRLDITVNLRGTKLALFR